MTDEGYQYEELMAEQQKRLTAISACFTRFYDSVTEEERAEMVDWADIAAASLPADWLFEAPIAFAEETK